MGIIKNLTELFGCKQEQQRQKVAETSRPEPEKTTKLRKELLDTDKRINNLIDQFKESKNG